MVFMFEIKTILQVEFQGEHLDFTWLSCFFVGNIALFLNDSEGFNPRGVDVRFFQWRDVVVPSEVAPMIPHVLVVDFLLWLVGCEVANASKCELVKYLGIPHVASAGLSWN